jgi:hypothetical protein
MRKRKQFFIGFNAENRRVGGLFGKAGKQALQSIAVKGGGAEV